MKNVMIGVHISIVGQWDQESGVGGSQITGVTIICDKIFLKFNLTAYPKWCTAVDLTNVDKLKAKKAWEQYMGTNDWHYKKLNKIMYSVPWTSNTADSSRSVPGGGRGCRVSRTER